MPDITLKNPLVVDGVTFPFVAVQLSILPQFVSRDEGGLDDYVIRVTCNFEAYRRRDDGTVERRPNVNYAEAEIPPLTFTDATAAAALDPVIARGMGLILAGVQTVAAQRDLING